MPGNGCPACLTGRPMGPPPTRVDGAGPWAAAGPPPRGREPDGAESRDPEAMALFSSVEDGRYVDANSAFVRNTGYSLEEVVGRRPEEVGLAADEQTAAALGGEPAADGGTGCVRVRLLARDGHLIEGLLSGHTLRLGSHQCRVWLIESIASPGRSEPVDQGATGRLEAVFRNTVVGVLVLDAAGRIRDCNEQTGRMTGSPVERLLGSTLDSLMEADGRLRVSATVACVAEQPGSCARVEARCSCAGGEPFWVDIALTSIEDPGRVGDAVAAVMVDIEQAKMAHIRALERTSQALEPALLGADVRVWDLDLRTGEMRGQPMWEGLHGHQIRPATTSFELFAAAIHPDDLAALVEANAEHMQGLTPYCEVEFRIRDGAESWRWLRQRCRIVEWDAQGDPVRVAGTYADITERKQAELERAQLEAQIQHSQKLESLGVMAGGIAHDFKNILVGVLGNTSLAMLQLPPDAPAREHILRAEAAARKASELAVQMLAYSGKGKRSVGPVDLHALVREMAELLKASLGGQVALHIGPAGATCTVAGDPTQLGQVALNLVVNAADAIGQRPGAIRLDVGQVHLATARHFTGGHGTELPPGDYVCLTVGDDGCGMDAGTQERIFEPFFTTKADGRGLGLATTMSIVSEHRGAIEAESRVGLGTTFRVYFPAAQAPAEQVQADRPAETPHSATGTLLVVDDDQTVRDVAQAVLQMAGFTVLPAADGQEALDLYHRHGADIVGVLLDLNMPVVDGEQVMAQIRQADPEVPVVLSSGDGAARARQLQASAFLDKPYGVKELLDVIHRVVQA